jgi:hypothetical protein
MLVKFREAFRWYKRGQEVEVAAPVGKLWASMRLVDVVDGTTAGVVETAESRQAPETATAAFVPPLRRKRIKNEVPKPEGDCAASGPAGDAG